MVGEAKTFSAGSNHCFTESLAPFLSITALACVLLAALLPTTASARTTRPYQSSFALPSHNDSQSMAVDQSNGDVYVGGSRFSAAGTPKDFTVGPAAGTNDLTAHLVALDSSGGSLNNTIYTVTKFGDHVEVFSGTGANLGTLTGAGTPKGKFYDICGITVDQSTGALYVTENAFNGHIWRFMPSSPSGSIDDSDYTVTGIEAEFPCGVAAASGAVYVNHTFFTETFITRFEAATFTAKPSGQVQSIDIDTGQLRVGPTAIAVDSENGELYVNEGHRVAVYDSSGIFLYSFGAAAYFGNKSEALAVKSAASGPASVVYVADPQHNSQEIDVFGAFTQVKALTRPKIASFGPDGTPDSSFSLLTGLAFDQATRRLYAVDADVPGIFGFEASAPPAYSAVTGFTPLTTAATGGANEGNAPGLAVDNTSLGSAGNLYLASGSTDLLYGWSSTPSALGGAFPVDPTTTPGPPEGSPNNLCGAAIDSEGNVWVANSQTKRVLKYSSAGVSLPGAIDTSSQGAPCQIAIDSQDDLYAFVANQDGKFRSGIWKYTAASGYASATRVAASPRSENIFWLTVDPSNDNLYVAVGSNCGSGGNNCNIRSWVDQYDPLGNLVDEFATDSASLSGIAVDAISHGVFVADRLNRKIIAFGPGVLLPEVTIRPSSGRTNTSATLHGLVNTQTVPLSDCRFEYVTEAAFRLTGYSDLGSGGSLSCSPAAGSIPLDVQDHPVSATAAGLTENTTYRFRLRASNVDGADNAEGSFATTGRPIVETTGAPIRSASTARLEGRVYAHGEETAYHFEYGAEGPCDANPCQSTEIGSAGSGEEIQLVSRWVEGLQPGTTYFYRLVAENDNPLGTGIGKSMTVTTRASDAPLSHSDFPGPSGSDRAWEQVSLPDSGGNPVPRGFAVSDNGDRAFYQVSGGTSISSSGSVLNMMYAERTETAPHIGGWQSREIGPPREQTSGNVWLEPAGSPDLSDQVAASTSSVTHKGALWRLRPGQPAVKVFDPEGPSLGFVASKDGSRILVESFQPLDPDYPGAAGKNWYDMSVEPPELVSLLPGESLSTCNTERAELSATGGVYGSLSTDASLFFFYACGVTPGLYMRDLDANQTRLIGESAFLRKVVPGAAFFTTTKDLDPVDEGGSDIYRYLIANESFKCVTCVAAGLNANVDTSRVAIALNGSRVYFVSPDALLPGAATPGIYRVEVGTGDLAYVAPGNPGIGGNTAFGAAISRDGSVIIFASKNTSLNTSNGQQNNSLRQYYRYDDDDRSLTCVSCPQSGDLPIASVDESLLMPSASGDEGVGANRTTLSADGGIFAFVTPTPLVHADQNTANSGQSPAVGSDVYEWRDGKLLLVTDGLTDWPASNPPRMSAITPSGRDILFTAATQYTPDALDGYSRLYDARVGGGFRFSPPPKPCPLEVCQGTPKGAPPEMASGTGSFAGPGNIGTVPRRRPCAKGRRKVRRAGKARCVKVQAKPHRKQAKHDKRGQR